MDTESQVLACDDARLRAMAEADIPTLERLMGATFFYTHRNGMSEGKDAFLDRIRNHLVRYHDPRRSEVEVNVFGDAAVMRGRLRMETELIQEKRRSSLDNRFMSVWIKSGGGWTIVGYASTPIGI
jgi:ketosteroid isomerase-like protein